VGEWQQKLKENTLAYFPEPSLTKKVLKRRKRTFERLKLSLKERYFLSLGNLDNNYGMRYPSLNKVVAANVRLARKRPQKRTSFLFLKVNYVRGIFWRHGT
jgi:hypothetical protein